MKRAIVVTILLALFLGPVSVIVDNFNVFANPFEYLDELREKQISLGLNGINNHSESAACVDTECNKYIVQFKSTAKLNDIYNSIKKYDYALLANSEQRVFSICLDDVASFKNDNVGILLSVEADSAMSLLAAVNDPIAETQWELESLNYYNAIEISKADSNVTVAVLDSGVYRQHEDFNGVNILAGYDAVLDSEGVYTDYNGHGTKVTSIIASASNNGIGMASIGAGLSILPVRVSDNSGYIYSTDFIQAVYFAADSGADIINMSFGGYVYSVAEEAATEYAASKGCILVSAAGNEATDIKYAGMKAYPASYENVISVGSVNNKGEVCSFSQYNDAVDLVAPGIELTVATMEGGYALEQGTSFSTAYVSAAIGLALSTIDEGITFNGEQFITLIASLNTNERNDYYGYGTVNLESLLRNINLPLYSGVISGGVYHHNITINFNRGVATLDGEPFVSGDTVLVSGNHFIEIVDGESSVGVSFITDNIPLKYDFIEEKDQVRISFERGDGLLDGLPYLSNTPITTNGKHCFVLTGPYGNTEEFNFECNFNPPEIFGVENGGYYTEPVYITVAGTGNVTLNSTPVYSGQVISKNGNYVLKVSSNHKEKTIHFTVNIPNINYYDSSVASAKMALDEEYGAFYLYNEILSGIRIYDVNNLSKTLSFIRTEDGIIGHGFNNEYFVMLHQSGVSLINREDLSKGEAGSLKFYAFSFNAISATQVGNSIYYIARNSEGIIELKCLNLDSKSDVLVTNLSDEYANIKSNGKTLLLTTSNGTICNYDLQGNRLAKTNTFSNISAVLFNDDYICTNYAVYNIDDLSPAFTIKNNEVPISVFNSILITNCSVYDIETGERIGAFDTPITDCILSAANVTYTYLSTLKIQRSTNSEIFDGDTALTKLNAALCNSFFIPSPEQTTEFQQTVVLPENMSIDAAVLSMNGSSIFAISHSERFLYTFETASFALKDVKPLKFLPSSISQGENTVYITFKEDSSICKYDVVKNTMKYYDCSRPYTAIKFYNGVLYCLTDSGDLYAHNVDDLSHSNVIIKAQNIKAFDVIDEYIYAYLTSSSVSFVYKISCENFTITASATVNAECNNLIATKNYLFVGTKVLLTETLVGVTTFVNDVKYADDKYALTGNELYSCDGFVLLGKHSHDTSLPLFDSNYNYFSFNRNIINKIKSYGNDLATLPDIEGLQPDAVLKGPVIPQYEYGAGYLDKVFHESGVAIENGGRHTFTVVLPFGISKSYSFYIDAVINSINLSFPKSNLSVNETLKATVSAKPITNVNVDTVYEASNDNVMVYSDGTIIGVTPGECTITATTADGLHSSSYTIKVIESTIVFDSSYFHEKGENIVCNISPGTSIEALRSAVSATYGKVIVTTVDGVEITEGVITTGMKVLLYNINGTIIDERQLSVSCDVDGDGYITANDYYTLKNIIASPDEASDAVAVSADTDGNGTIDRFDLLTIKEHLLGHIRIQDNDAAIRRTSRAVAHLITPKYITSGTTMTFGLTLTDAQNVSGISGILKINTSVYTILDVNVCSGKSEGFYSVDVDGVHFFAECDSFLETQVIMTVTVEVSDYFTESESASILCENIELYDGSAAVSATATATPNYSANAIADILIFNSPDFQFSADIEYYNLNFPLASSQIYVGTYPESDFIVTGSTTFIEGNAIFSAMLDNDNETVKYSFVCKAENNSTTDNINTTLKDTNSYLQSIEVEGGTLSPRFDATVYEYFIVCKNPEALTVNANAISEKATVNVGYYDIDKQTISICCTAEDGNNTYYTLNISTGSPADIDLPDPQPNYKWLWGIIGGIVFLLLSLLIIHQLKVMRNESKTK